MAARRETGQDIVRRAGVFEERRLSTSASRGPKRKTREARRNRETVSVPLRRRAGECFSRGVDATEREWPVAGRGEARTTKARTSAVANAGSPSPDWYAAPVASAVTSELCDDGNPPLPTIMPTLNRPVTVQSLNGLSTCATTTAIMAATRPTLSPIVVASLLMEDTIASAAEPWASRRIAARAVRGGMAAASARETRVLENVPPGGLDAWSLGHRTNEKRETTNTTTKDETQN